MGTRRVELVEAPDRCGAAGTRPFAQNAKGWGTPNLSYRGPSRKGGPRYGFREGSVSLCGLASTLSQRTRKDGAPGKHIVERKTTIRAALKGVKDGFTPGAVGV